MSDYTPTTEAALVAEVYRVINSHGWMAGKAGVCVCGHDVDAVIGGTMNEHRAQAVVSEVLAAAGVAPQPEPEYEYSWEGVDEEGDDWIMDEWFATVAGAERYADSRMGNWVRTDNGKLIRRVKAGAWEPAPNQEGEHDGNV